MTTSSALRMSGNSGQNNRPLKIGSTSETITLFTTGSNPGERIFEMITGKVLDGTYFKCDRCGQEYTFSGSYLTVRAGHEYCPAGGELTVADCDLCRDCAGQTAKFAPGVETQLTTEIVAIDAATGLLEACKAAFERLEGETWVPAKGKRLAGDRLVEVEYDLHSDGTRCYWGDTCPDKDEHQ